MSKSVSDKIADGDYKTKLDYPVGKGEDKTLARRAYQADQSRLQEQFKTDALVELGRLKLDSEGKVIFKHTKADLLWDKAWDMGHASGLSEVWNYMMDLDDLLD